MDGMMENNNENSTGCGEIGICGECRHFLRFDELSGMENICGWKGRNRSVAGKVVKCSGYEAVAGIPSCFEGDEMREENGALDKSHDRGVGTPDKVEGTGKRVEVVDVYDERDNTAEWIRDLGLGDDVEKIGSLSKGDRKFLGLEVDVEMMNKMREKSLNDIRRERDRLDKMIKEMERREQDLVVARNERIVWERRLKCVEVGSGVKIGDVEIRTKEEIEAVVRMFQEIEALREG